MPVMLRSKKLCASARCNKFWHSFASLAPLRDALVVAIQAQTGAKALAHRSQMTPMRGLKKALRCLWYKQGSARCNEFWHSFASLAPLRDALVVAIQARTGAKARVAIDSINWNCISHKTF